MITVKPLEAFCSNKIEQLEDTKVQLKIKIKNLQMELEVCNEEIEIYFSQINVLQQFEAMANGALLAKGIGENLNA